MRSTAAFDLIAGRLPEPILLVSIKGELLAANRSARALFALNGRPVAGTRLDALVQGGARIAEYLRMCARSGQMVPGSFQLRASARGAAIRCEGARFPSEGGQPPAVLLRALPKQETVQRFLALNDRIDALAKEIRRREQAEEALSESESQFRSLADSIPNLCWMANADGWIYWYNQRWYEFTGTTPEQMAGWGWQSVHHPATLPSVLARWKESIATARPFDMIFPLRRADGVFGEFLTRVVPLRDKQGKVVRWFGTNTDVSALKRTEEELRRSQERLRISEERLRLTQKAARIGSWELDLDTEEYICSPEVYDILGLKPSSPLTRDLLLGMMYFSSDRQNSEKALRVAATKNREFSTQFRVRRPDGKARWIAARGKPFFNQGRTVLLGLFIDISDARKTQEPAEAPTRTKTNTKAAGRRAG